jgi:hypothetical protein
MKRLSFQFWATLFALVVECGLFAWGIGSGAPLWYNIIIGIFVVFFGFLTLDLFIIDMSDSDDY